MVEINRVWLNVDTDTNKITLFGRPRVSIRVDEYIWSLIEEHIVKPHKLMRSEKHRYLLKISFHRFDPVRHRYYPLSPYNGPLLEGVKPDSANGWYPREDFADSEERTTWFSPDKIWTSCGAVLCLQVMLRAKRQVFRVCLRQSALTRQTRLLPKSLPSLKTRLVRHAVHVRVCTPPTV